MVPSIVLMDNGLVVLLDNLAMLVYVLHLLYAQHRHVMERNIVAMVNGLIVHQARRAAVDNA
jgi:hypothetical protein